MVCLVTTVIRSSGKCRWYFAISATTAVGSADIWDEATGASTTTVVCVINSQFTAVPSFSWKLVSPWLDLLEMFLVLCLPLSLACKCMTIQLSPEYLRIPYGQMGEEPVCPFISSSWLSPTDSGKNGNGKALGFLKDLHFWKISGFLCSPTS